MPRAHGATFVQPEREQQAFLEHGRDLKRRRPPACRVAAGLDPPDTALISAGSGCRLFDQLSDDRVLSGFGITGSGTWAITVEASA